MPGPTRYTMVARGKSAPFESRMASTSEGTAVAVHAVPPPPGAVMHSEFEAAAGMMQARNNRALVRMVKDTSPSSGEDFAAVPPRLWRNGRDDRTVRAWGHRNGLCAYCT